MPSSSTKKSFIRSLLDTVDLGCSCNRQKPSDAVHPKPKLKPKPSPRPTFPTSSETADCGSCTSSSAAVVKLDADDSEPAKGDDSGDTKEIERHSGGGTGDEPAPAEGEDVESGRRRRRRSGSGGGGGVEESVAVEKVSADPYRDFRESMVQMIVEKEIKSREELKGLLRRFLDLNSPRHHDTIIRAFTEILDLWINSSTTTTTTTGGDGGGDTWLCT